MKLSYSKRKTLEKYNKLLDAPLWTNQNIINFKGLINRTRWMNNEPEYQQAILDIWHRFHVVVDNRDIDREHSDKGIQWLNKLLFTKAGSRRNTKVTRCIPNHVFDRVRDFKKFTFEGYHVNFDCTGDYLPLSPIYRVHTHSGGAFDYCYNVTDGGILTGSELNHY